MPLRWPGKIRVPSSLPCVLACAAPLVLAACAQGGGVDDGPPGGQTRTYYIAAERVAWDYAPSGKDGLTGKPFDARESLYMQSGPHRIGHVHDKAVYRAYTDATFTVPKPIAPEDEHLAVLGPVVRAVVGDTIHVVFKNETDHMVSVHPHGVFYDKSSEGAGYDDGTSGAAKADDAIAPGQVYTYVWEVPERAGPGPMDGSTALWMYHSHVDEPADTNAGLIGPLVVTSREHALPDARPDDVDRELFTLFTIFDENKSFYLADNIAKYTSDPWNVDRDDPDFQESNKMHSINGRSFANLTGLTMHVGERVRWYVFAQGSESDLHTPHWHGNTVTAMGMHTDVVSLLPMGMVVADMVPDDPGTWMFHCHVDDHLMAGMTALYTVLP